MTQAELDQVEALREVYAHEWRALDAHVKRLEARKQAVWELSAAVLSHCDHVNPDGSWAGGEFAESGFQLCDICGASTEVDQSTCTHTMPDGSSAVEGGFMFSTCKLCGMTDL